MRMNSTIFRQYEGAWAKKAYPGKGYTVSGAGCGLLALTHVAIEQEAKKNWTPENLRSYMINKGYVTYGNGTKWDGITQTLKYIGHKKVVYITEAIPMKDAFVELDKSNRIGIILFYGGYSKKKKKWYKTPDGTVWTTDGHYIAFTDYKVTNGQHWFYLKDSGGRKHDGWYCYEKSMKGCVGQLWIVERTGTQAAAKQKYTGALPAVSGGARMINYAASQKGKYATRTNGGKDGKKYTNKFTKYFAGKGGIDSKGQMPNVYGYIPGYCTLFACYCLAKLGLALLVPFSTLTNKSKGYWWHAPSLMKYYKSKGLLVTSASKAKTGALAFKGSGSPTHTAIFVKYENGYVYTWDGNVGGGVTYNKRKASVFCGYANLALPNYFGKGSTGPDVLKWQRFLNWYFGKQVVAEDGDFGTYTDKYTKAFQKAKGITADGLVGTGSLAAAKKAER